MMTEMGSLLKLSMQDLGLRCVSLESNNNWLSSAYDKTIQWIKKK